MANRRALDEAVPAAWTQAQGRRRPLALLMIDIDHFKAYNDHYGHVSGDHCLQQVAQALAGAIQRQGELVARYGGEEFAVLLPEADSAQALATAQRLCATVRALALEHQTSPVSHCVTISVGATCVYPENSPAEPGIAQLFEQADAALYQSKPPVATAPRCGPSPPLRVGQASRPAAGWGWALSVEAQFCY